MDTITLTAQNQSHGSDVKEFEIYPYGVTPQLDTQWLWIVIPLAAVGVGLVYLVVKK